MDVKEYSLTLVQGSHPQSPSKLKPQALNLLTPWTPTSADGWRPKRRCPAGSGTGKKGMLAKKGEIKGLVLNLGGGGGC